MRTSLLAGVVAGSVVVAATATTFADTITLKNGRRIEGRVLSRTSTAVKIEVPGGEMDLPRSQVASIEESLTLEDEYASRYQKIDLEDADALDGLAVWARKHDLEQRARFLEDHAKGVRLEKRFAQARTASELLDVAAWAKAQGFSIEVRRLALSRALALDPRSAAVRHELTALREEQAAADKAAEAERLRALGEREKQVGDRERAVALRERVVRERSRGAGETARTDEAGRGLGPDGSAPLDGPAAPGAGPGVGPDETPPPNVTVVFVRRGRSHLRVDDNEEDPTKGGRAAPQAPAPSPGAGAAPSPNGAPPRTAVNPLPAAPRLPPSPGTSNSTNQTTGK